MKTWKLVSGILSIVLFVLMMVQSCAATALDAINRQGGTSGGAGVICAALILAGGIVSIATRNSEQKGGNISLIILFGLCAIIGFTSHGIYKDLIAWSIWAVINAVLALVALKQKSKA
ncbi:MAG: hypothetical protein Q4P72_04120 [Eubacteriales bacterium]|nr:hypothetical protein [Eubacteriales bacterium]